MQPALTVVIAAYNAAGTLGAQLAALAGQAPELRWDVLVVDNRSTDGTAAVAEGYRDRLDLRVVPAPAKASGAYARNVGVAATPAPWVAFVDADDEVAPGWVEAMARGLAEHRFVVGPLDTERLNTPAVARSRPIPQLTGLQWWQTGPELPHAGGGNMGIHRDVYEAVGGFDEELAGLQDVDFCWRVQLTGVPLVFLPDPVLRVRLRSSVRGMWKQGRNYGAAQAQIERRFAAVGPDDVPPAVRVPRPVGGPHPGRLRSLVELAGSVRRPGQLIWQTAWRVGHRLGDGSEDPRSADLPVAGS